MAVPKSAPAPRRNQTLAGWAGRLDDIASTDILVAAGDFTGGAAEDLFTLSSHGLVDGDIVYAVYQSAVGGVTGGVGRRCVVNQLDANTFQLTTDGSTVIENTADATVVFLKGNGVPQRIVDALIPQLIFAAGDFTGGAAEDIFTPAQGTMRLDEADPIKLLYESAAGVILGAVDVTYYAKTVTATTFLTSTTAGGAVQENTADGNALFLKLA